MGEKEKINKKRTAILTVRKKKIKTINKYQKFMFKPV